MFNKIDDINLHVCDKQTSPLTEQTIYDKEIRQSVQQ